MKNSFLEHVAKDLIAKFGTDLSRVAVVFPNKRASLFMNNHLARLADSPVWSPTYITISELFRRHSSLAVADPIKSICDLHRSFVECTAKEETLDQFYGWGQLLLSDFDDIDKSMADADKLFANLKSIHQLDDVSYLTEEQKKMLKRFFSTFNEDHPTELKKRFIDLWSHFADIYHHFNRRLSEQGLAYEGALYRNVATDPHIAFEYPTYVFVGFNVLQKVEQTLFDRLQREQKAKFYWDFDHYYMADEQQEAGHYIRRHLERYPNELNSTDAELYSRFEQPKDIAYIAAPTESIQAHYINQWLSRCDRAEAGPATAIVMCDESLLQSAVHAIPPTAGQVNITTGYPLSQSPAATLARLLIRLQTVDRTAADRYPIKAVRRLLRHPYVGYLSENAEQLATRLTEQHIFYPTLHDLAEDEALATLFGGIDPGADNLALSQWMADLFRQIGIRGRDLNDAFFHESVFSMYTLVNRISELIRQGDLIVDTPTYERLLIQLIQTTAIPFHGEPAEGIQLMGVLETRNLDFDHLLVLSCNEGNMPKGTADASFIPHAIREAYGLTTVNHKVAIYAYYFHRMLQRATDITLAYNNATEGTHTGEMSRFMLQLMVEATHPIRRRSLSPGQALIPVTVAHIPKTPQVIAALHRLDSLSPTAINRYLRCPLQFYYNTIAGLEQRDAEDEVDNRMFGNIFHRTTELAYTYLTRNNPQLQPEDIRRLRTDTPRIEAFVDRAFDEEFFKTTAHNPRPAYNGLQLINRKVIAHYLRKLLGIDQQLAPFAIEALEEKVETNLSFTVGQTRRTLSIGGYIDRLDCIAQADGTCRIRVVDYKTGHPAQQTPTGIDDLFDPRQLAPKHTDYYLQAFLYALIVRRHPRLNPQQLPVSPALLFIQHNKGADDDPTLVLAKEYVTDIEKHAADFEEKLKQLLSEIYNADLPFVPTPEKERCTHCPYKKLCGR